MNIKKLLSIAILVVGLVPQNARSAQESCLACRSAAQPENPYAQEALDLERMNEIEDAEPDENTAAIIELLQQQNPNTEYESHPANVYYHDQFAPCDAQFEERVREDEEEEPIIIYRVR